ncbi:unnamed protein product [Albugo candida]|uniref:Protein transport protein sec16 n=1 Tax=Albugo candida TaxID=65357 RepID=A0A024FZS4_9STRA|nr:unnamed protein product [Albugo candida]|eukprot:CCI40104.1 unnamed protein product [Albugo candida]
MEADTTQETFLASSASPDHIESSSSRSDTTSKRKIEHKSDSQSLKLQFSKGAASAPPALTFPDTREDFFASVGLKTDRPISFGFHPPDPIEKLTKKQANLTVVTAFDGELAESLQNVTKPVHVDSVKDSSDPFSMDVKDEEFVKEVFSDSWSVDSPVIFSPRSDAPVDSVTTLQDEEIKIADDEELTWNEKDDELIDNDCVMKAPNMSDSELQWDNESTRSITRDIDQGTDQFGLTMALDASRVQNEESGISASDLKEKNQSHVDDEGVCDIMEELQSLKLEKMVQQKEHGSNDVEEEEECNNMKIEDCPLETATIAEERSETQSFAFTSVTTTTHTISEIDDSYVSDAAATSIFSECQTSSTKVEALDTVADHLLKTCSQNTYRDDLTDLLTQVEQNELKSKEDGSFVNWSIQSTEIGSQQAHDSSYSDGLLHTATSYHHSGDESSSLLSEGVDLNANITSTHAITADAQPISVSTSTETESTLVGHHHNDELYSMSVSLKDINGAEAEVPRSGDADNVISAASTAQEDYNVDEPNAHVLDSAIGLLSDITMSKELPTDSRTCNDEWIDPLNMVQIEESSIAQPDSTLSTARNETACISHDYLFSPIDNLTSSTEGAFTIEQPLSTISPHMCGLNGFDPVNDAQFDLSSTVATFGGSDNTSESMQSGSCFSDYPSQTVSTASNMDYTSSMFDSEQALSQDGGDSETNLRADTWLNVAVQDLNPHAGQSDNVERPSVFESAIHEPTQKMPVDSFISTHRDSFETLTNDDKYQNVSYQDDTAAPSNIESNFIPSASSLFGDTDESGNAASFLITHRNQAVLQEVNLSGEEILVEDASKLFGAGTSDTLHTGSDLYEATHSFVPPPENSGGIVDQNTCTRTKNTGFESNEQEAAIDQALENSFSDCSKHQEPNELFTCSDHQIEYIENDIVLGQTSLCPTNESAGIDFSQEQCIGSGDKSGEGTPGTTMLHEDEKSGLLNSSSHYHFGAPSSGGNSYFEDSSNSFCGVSFETRLDGALEGSNDSIRHRNHDHESDVTHNFYNAPPNSTEEVPLSSASITHSHIKLDEASFGQDQENIHLISAKSTMTKGQHSHAPPEGTAGFEQTLNDGSSPRCVETDTYQSGVELNSAMAGCPDAKAETLQMGGGSFLETTSLPYVDEGAMDSDRTHDFITTTPSVEQFADLDGKKADSSDFFGSNSTELDGSSLFQDSPPEIDRVFGHNAQPRHDCLVSHDWGNDTNGQIPPSHEDAMTRGPIHHFVDTASTIEQFRTVTDSSNDTFGHDATQMSNSTLFQHPPPEPPIVLGHNSQTGQRITDSCDWDKQPSGRKPPSQEDAMTSGSTRQNIETASSAEQFENIHRSMDSSNDAFGYDSTQMNDNTLFQHPPPESQRVYDYDIQPEQRVASSHDWTNPPIGSPQTTDMSNAGTWEMERHSQSQNCLETFDSQSQPNFFDTGAPPANDPFSNRLALEPHTLNETTYDSPQGPSALPYSAQHASHHQYQPLNESNVHSVDDQPSSISVPRGYRMPGSTAPYTKSADVYSSQLQDTSHLFMTTPSHPSLPTQNSTQYVQSDTLSDKSFFETTTATLNFENGQQVHQQTTVESQIPVSNAFATMQQENSFKTEVSVSGLTISTQATVLSGAESRTMYTDLPAASQVSNIVRTESHLSSDWNDTNPSSNFTASAQANIVQEPQIRSPFSPTGRMVSQYGSPSSSNATQHSAAQKSEKFGVREKRYDDPTILPPSCLISFGFGGNVVSMFPKRKVRLANNLRRVQGTASALLDSPRGEELRKGPIQFYHISQLYPKKWFQDAFHQFPGPLTKESHQEDIVRYLDTKLERSDEDERLLLGVLRVLLTSSNGEREDYTGGRDVSTEGNQLVALLQHSDERRRGGNRALFQHPNAKKTESAEAHAQNTSRIRSLLLNGDRRGAVEAAMRSHMWPEAMLIASFIEKEEYKRVLHTYFNGHYSVGDPSRALYMAFADQQQKSVYEPQTTSSSHGSPPSPILANWVSHAQMLIANRTADTNKILTELGDRLWREMNSVVSAHICYLLAGIPIEAPSPNSRIALLGGDHRTNTEARFYVSPNAVQRTEIYEWIHKRANPGVNLIPFQGYKLIYAMILADHGEVETSLKYVTSMLEIVRGVTANMKPGTSMYLEGMQNQLVVLDDRLRQHLGRDRAESLTSIAGKPGGKWGLGSALSIVGKIVNRVVEGNDGLSPRANASPSLRQKSMPSDTQGLRSEGTSIGTDQMAKKYMEIPPGTSLDTFEPRAFTGAQNARANPTKPLPPPIATPATYQAPIMSEKPSVGFDSMATYNQTQQQPTVHQYDHVASFPQGAEPENTIVPPTIAAHGHATGQGPHLFRKMHSMEDTVQTESSAQLMRTSSFPIPGDRGPAKSGSPSDQGSPSPRAKDARKKGRSKTPPPSSSKSSNSSGWFSGLSSFIATKINPEAKVAKLGEQMEAYFDEEKKQWIFPGETVVDETKALGPPPVGPKPAGNGPPIGGSAPTSSSGGVCATDSNDPLAALMAPPMSRAHASMVKMDPLAAMMAPPKRHGLHTSRAASEGLQKKKSMPPRPQFAVFKPMRTSVSSASSSAPNSTNGSSPFPNSQEQEAL